MNKEELRKIFNNIDPIGIFFEDNIDEYDSEIEKILQNQSELNNEQKTHDYLVKVLIENFGKEEVDRFKKRIQDLAVDIYKYKSEDKSVLNYEYKKGFENKVQEKIVRKLHATPNWLVVLLFSLLVAAIVIVVTLLS